jgi:pilus assembly protein CpaB
VQSQVEIVRFVKDVQQGDMITADMVTTVKVGGYNLPDNVLRQSENVVGRYARYDMRTGDYILSEKLSDAPFAEFAYLHELDGTKEAMSITIKSFAAGLSGKLEAGDIVSIIASDVGDFRATLAPPELRYVQVLAVTDNKGFDKEFAEHSRNEDKDLPATVTLLVVPAQAIILAELEATGRIHCTLVYRGEAENLNSFLQIQDEFLSPPVAEDEFDDVEIKENNFHVNSESNIPHGANEVQNQTETGVVIYRADGSEVRFDD